TKRIAGSKLASARRWNMSFQGVGGTGRPGQSWAPFVVGGAVATVAVGLPAWLISGAVRDSAYNTAVRVGVVQVCDEARTGNLTPLYEHGDLVQQGIRVQCRTNGGWVTARAHQPLDQIARQNVSPAQRAINGNEGADGVTRDKALAAFVKAHI